MHGSSAEDDEDDEQIAQHAYEQDQALEEGSHDAIIVRVVRRILLHSGSVGAVQKSRVVVGPVAERFGSRR